MLLDEKSVKVFGHTEGYSTVDGACCSASFGVTATCKMRATVTATTERDIRKLEDIIKINLKDEHKEEFSKEFNGEYSLNVAWDWLGIQSDGEYVDGEHVEKFEGGKTSVDHARKSFSEALKQKTDIQVVLEGEAKIEGTTSQQARYCLYYAVERVEWSNDDLHVVNENPDTVKTTDIAGNWVPHTEVNFNVIPPKKKKIKTVSHAPIIKIRFPIY